VVIEYTDFFNDSSIGHVIPAKVMNWDTNKYEYIYYTGDINYSIQMPPTPSPNQAVPENKPNKPVLKTVKCDSKGNFTLNYDFKPNDEVSASLNLNGVIVRSQTVKPDTNISAKALVETNKKVYAENDRLIEQRKEIDHIFLYNLRGSKSVDLTGTFDINYSLYQSPLCFVIDMTTGLPLVPPNQLKTFELSQKIDPVYTYKSVTIPGKTGQTNLTMPIATGSSQSSREFVTEWGWNSDGAQPGTVMNPLPDNGTITFRYDVNEQKPKPGPGETLRKGVDYLMRTGTLTVVYEGVVIVKIDVIRDLDHEYSYANTNRITGLNPVARKLIDIVQSHINPAMMDINQRFVGSAMPAR
jgi:hypothetical protein